MERVNNPFDFGVKAFPILLKLEVEKSEIKGSAIITSSASRLLKKVFNLVNEEREGIGILDGILCDKGKMDHP